MLSTEKYAVHMAAVTLRVLRAEIRRRYADLYDTPRDWARKASRTLSNQRLQVLFQECTRRGCLPLYREVGDLEQKHQRPRNKSCRRTTTAK